MVTLRRPLTRFVLICEHLYLQITEGGLHSLSEWLPHKLIGIGRQGLVSSISGDIQRKIELRES